MACTRSTSPRCFTSAATCAHVLNHISVCKQTHICIHANRTRLKTKTSVAFAGVPVLRPTPPSYDPTYPMGTPPPPPVHNVYLPVHQRHVRFDVFYIKPPPVAPKRVAVPSAPTVRPPPLLASELGGPWCSGPKAVMQAQRPIGSQLPPGPWTLRPQSVPGRARDQPTGIVTHPAVRGQSIIPVPRMAVSKSTSLGSRDDSIN